MSSQVALWRNPRFSTEPAHCWEQGTEVDCNCNLSSISRCLTSPKTSSGDHFDALQFCTWVGFCWGRNECHVSVSMASFFDILGHKMSFNQGQRWSKPTGNQLPYHCHPPAMEKILTKKKHGECIIIYSWFLFPHPSEKYARQNGNHLPQFSGWTYHMFEFPWPRSLTFWATKCRSIKVKDGQSLPETNCHTIAIHRLWRKFSQKKKHGECIIIYSWFLFPTHLKNMLVKMGIIFPNFRGEHITCLSSHCLDKHEALKNRWFLLSFSTLARFPIQKFNMLNPKKLGGFGSMFSPFPVK